MAVQVEHSSRKEKSYVLLARSHSLVKNWRWHYQSSVRLRCLAHAPSYRSQSRSRYHIGIVTLSHSGDHRHRCHDESALVEAYWLHLLKAGCSFTAALRAVFILPVLWWLVVAPLIGYGVVQIPSVAMVAFYAGFILLIGFVEEVYFRGMMLQALKSRGLWHATVVTAFLFGAVHALNALYGASSLYTVLQVGYAVAFGLSFAALVLVTRLIWPLILAHALTDFSSILNSAGGLKSTAVTPTDYAITAFAIIVFTTYAVILLVREQRKESLRYKRDKRK